MTDEFSGAFAQESEEQITELNNALLAFENDPSDEAAMEQIFRTAHTLKGNCGAMGFDAASEVAHAIEDLLESIRAGRVDVTPELMDAIFAGVDELEAAIDEAARHGEVQRDTTDAIGRLRAYADPPGLAEPTEREIEDVLATVASPADSEHSVYHVRIEVADDPARNGGAVVDALDDAFDLLGTDPEREVIADGDYDGVFDAVFASVVERSAVEAALDPVDAVAEHVVSDVTDSLYATDSGGSATGAAGSSTSAVADESTGGSATGTADDASADSTDRTAVADSADQPATDDSADRLATGDSADRPATDDPAPFAADEETAAPETDSSEAAAVSTAAEAADDMSVDELLQDDEVDQFDDLDGLAEEVDDVSEFDDLDDAGSFADLGVSADDVAMDAAADSEDDAALSEDAAADATADEIGDATSDDVTSAAPSADADANASDDAAADDGDQSEATDEIVQDATSEFEQLKEEVDPVGFDELQDEIEELEFDEYDSDDEVGFDELLGEEEIADEDSFGGPAESLAESERDRSDASESTAAESTAVESDDSESDVAIPDAPNPDTAESADELEPRDADPELSADESAADAEDSVVASEDSAVAGDDSVVADDDVAPTDDSTSREDSPTDDLLSEQTASEEHASAGTDTEDPVPDETPESIADAVLPDESTLGDDGDTDDRLAGDDLETASDSASESASDSEEVPLEDATAAELFGQPDEVPPAESTDAAAEDSPAGAEDSPAEAETSPTTSADSTVASDEQSVESAVDAGLDAAEEFAAEASALDAGESTNSQPEPADESDPIGRSGSADGVPTESADDVQTESADDVQTEPVDEVEAAPSDDAETDSAIDVEGQSPEITDDDSVDTTDDGSVDSTDVDSVQSPVDDSEDSTDDGGVESPAAAEVSPAEDSGGSEPDASDEPEFDDGDVELDDGTVPVTEVDEVGDDEGVPVGSGSDVTDDSFDDPEAVEASSTTESETPEPVDGFGESDSVLDLGSGRSPASSPQEETDDGEAFTDDGALADDGAFEDAGAFDGDGAFADDDEETADDDDGERADDDIDGALDSDETVGEESAFDHDEFDDRSVDDDPIEDDPIDDRSDGTIDDPSTDDGSVAEDGTTDEGVAADAGTDEETATTETVDDSVLGDDSDDESGSTVSSDAEVSAAEVSTSEFEPDAIDDAESGVDVADVDDLLSSDDGSGTSIGASDEAAGASQLDGLEPDADAGAVDGFGASESPLDDPGFSDPTEEYGDAVVSDVDEERIERVRTLGVPDREGDGDASGTGGQSIRVDVEQLDEMLNLVEGLVTSRARLRRAVDENEPHAVLEDEIDDLEDVTSELQDTVMDVRLVPLRRSVSKLPRIVRDVAREQEKDVDFEVVGEDVELDRSILEEIGDPLVHLVRNAVDHGIEQPDERAAADKPETGSVELRARRERDRVLVTVEDDGRGIEPDDLRDAAVEEGIHTREEVHAMDDETALELVFHPGLSTAEEVTDVSGRGVGMDVVAETAEALDGSVEIDSEPGEGTTVELELPVTLAIAEMLFVEVGGEEYGVPVDVVDEIGPVVGVETQDGQEVLVSDGGEDERELLRLDDALETGARTDPGLGMLVHLRDDVREATLLCDDVRGQQEIVVKPFEGVLGDVPGLAGATVLGDGDVVNILDVETL